MPLEQKHPTDPADLDIYIQSRQQELQQFELDLHRQKELYLKEKALVEQDISQLKKAAGNLTKSISSHMISRSAPVQSKPAVTENNKPASDAQNDDPVKKERPVSSTPALSAAYQRSSGQTLCVFCDQQRGFNQLC